MPALFSRGRSAPSGDLPVETPADGLWASTPSKKQEPLGEVMPTQITYKTAVLPPTEMWVEGNTARDYLSQGFEIVDYEPPADMWRWCWSGRALIRKTGGPTTHRFSPELVALHKFVCHTLDTCAPPFGKRGFTPAKREFGEGHSRLFNEIEYHETLMNPLPGETLEDVRARVVHALRRLAKDSAHKRTRQAWETCADAVNRWLPAPGTTNES